MYARSWVLQPSSGASAVGAPNWLWVRLDSMMQEVHQSPVGHHRVQRFCNPEDVEQALPEIL